MDSEQIKQIRLYNQHITNKTDKYTVVHDLNGLQAQFIYNVLYSLKFRCKEKILEENFGDNLIKNWTIRGTVHAFNEDDLPIFLHESKSHNKSVCEIIEGDWRITKERNEKFANIIIDGIRNGIGDREELKLLCRENGMTDIECESVFDQWGGTIRFLAENGYICYTVEGRKRFIECPDFVPWEKEDAKLEIVRRYFTHFAPATIKDAAYYLGTTQKQIKKWIDKLDINNFMCEGKEYFYIDNGETNFPDIPKCNLLSGFDQLMLGYEKKESIFLDNEFLRGIFTLSGIVMPAVLIAGKVVGRWKRTKSKIEIICFKNISIKDRQYIEQAFEEEFDSIKRIKFI